MKDAKSLPEKDEEENESETQDLPRLELTTQIQIDESDSERKLDIGSELRGELKHKLISFLKENKPTFSWKTKDMSGIDVSIASHQLNVDPRFQTGKTKMPRTWPKLG